MVDTTLNSPILTDMQLPTDGIPIVQPKELLPKDTISSPVIVDRDITLLDKNLQNINSTTGQLQVDGVYMFGTSIRIDGPNKRIIINDGKTDRIIIGRYP